MGRTGSTSVEATGPGAAPGGRGRAARRRYDSPLRTRRAEETRSSLVAAATQLFTEQGWAGTGMRQIAATAGVAVETLYSHFPSKRKLFDAVVDQAVVGDDAPVAVADRPEFAALGRGRRAARLAAAASLVLAVNQRTSPFASLIREAATTDPEIRELLRATRERQRADVTRAVGLVLGRPPTDDERDGVWAIVSPEVHLLLVEESGWEPQRYERWVAETLGSVLPRS